MGTLSLSYSLKSSLLSFLLENVISVAVTAKASTCLAHRSRPVCLLYSYSIMNFNYLELQYVKYR